ncbi:MAG TPA: tetratricopeptide repeat protein [Thermoanaerobaculia bacterium]
MRVLYLLLAVLVSHPAAAQSQAQEATKAFDQAQALLDEKELDRALARARQALALQEKVYGPEDPRVAEFHVLIGQVLSQKKDLDGALDETLRALQLTERALGPDHPGIAVIAGNIANILHTRGDLDGAVTYHRRALRIFEAARNEAQASQVLANIGSTLELKGDLPGALDATRKALARTAAVFGPDHFRVGRLRRNLGMILLKMGDLDGALQESRGARQILERAPETTDPELAIMFSNLGQIFRERGDLVTALDFLQSARRLDEKTYGPEHPEVARRLQKIAGVLRDKGNLDRALTTIQQALRIDTQVSGPDQPEVARDNQTLAQILLDRGNVEEALKVCRIAISIDELHFGDRHPHVARDSETLAAILLAQGDEEGALRAAERALKIASDTYKTDVPLVALYASRVGEVLQAKGDLQGARSHFERARSILLKTYGPDNPATRKVEKDLQALSKAYWKKLLPVIAVLLAVLVLLAVILARRRILARRAATAALETVSYPLSSSSFSRAAHVLERLGPYRLEERLGAGGMGVVYRAYDERLDRSVAIKVIPPAHSEDPQRRERLRREARASARLSHPAIIQVYDFVQTEEVDAIVMELVEGERLSDLLLRGPLDLDRGLTIAREVAEALAEAHSKGIVHRDLKTENVIVTLAGHAKVLDFGIAKQLDGGDPSLTKEGAVLGTFRSMAPEQAQGHEVDHRADLFALGTLLYEIFTGESPFAGPNGAATLRKICWHQQPPAREVNPKVPDELSDLIDGLLRKEPHHRPQETREVAALLARMAPGTASSSDAQTQPDGGGTTIGFFKAK